MTAHWSCSVCGHIHERQGEDGMVNLDTRQCYDCGVCLTKERRKHEAEAEAKALVDSLGKFVNGMSREQADAFATALANEHPTLLGQIAKAVGTGVMRRASYDPEWQPFTPTDRRCPQSLTRRFALGLNDDMLLPVHDDHDGRLDCTTVIGAELMARQSYI